MNIKEYKNAYDGIHATRSLKKRVMDAAERADEEPRRTGARKDGKRRILLPVLGGAAGIAAAFAVIVFGGGFFRSLFSEEREIVVTAPEMPDPVGFSALAPTKQTIGELSSPKLNPSPDVYETMPALPLGEEERTRPFRTNFRTFPDALTEAVGESAFAEWIDHFSALPPYYTFYNNPNLLSYVVYFDISEEKARAILEKAGGLTEDEIGAVAGRKEELCRRLFVNDEIPLVTCAEQEGYRFYTVENLYETSSERLAALLRREGYTASEPPEPMFDLLRWAQSSFEDSVYGAAAERKSLLVTAALYEDGLPSLPEDSFLHEIYDPAVSDFGETLDLNGVTIYNYVLKLVKDHAPDDAAYESAVTGAASEPNRGTIPSYRRLLALESLNITPEMLGEALDMIDRHYYGQTGERLYSDEALGAILYGTDEEFEETFLSPYTFCSEENPVGSLWLSGAEIYEAPVSAWLEYGDLSEEYLWRVEDALDGMAKKFFRRKIEYYREIRLLTAESLDGGAMAADEALTEMPALPETLLPTLAFEQYGETNVSAAGIYHATLTELARIKIDGRELLDFVRRMIEEHPELQSYAYQAPLLRKAYLYLWHTDSVNLYCDEYLKTLDLFMQTNYSVRTDGKTLYIGYGNGDLPDWANESPLLEYAAAHHLTRTAPYSEYQAPAETKTATVRDFTGESALYLAVSPNPILPNAAERGIWVCAGFGYDPWLEQEHSGIDFAAATGDGVAAIAEGTVTRAGEQGDLGLCVILDHGNGLTSLYAHCAELYVTAGQAVQKGELLAAVGSTGFSAGPHLHFEMREDETPIDPLPYLNGEKEIESDPALVKSESYYPLSDDPQ